MSKRINYKKDESLAPVDRAIILPNAAPNASKKAVKSSKMSRGAKVLAVLLIIVAIVAITFAVVSLIINSYVAKISAPHYEDVKITQSDLNYNITNYQTEKAKEFNPEGFEKLCMDTLLNYAEASHSIKSDENVINFAIYGINKDSNASGGVASFVSLVSFNKETKKVSFAVFKEKVLVYIPVLADMGGLQDAYEYGGSALLTKTIKYNFGIDINGYIEVNMNAASRLVDNVGGIQIANTDTVKVNSAIESYNEKFNKQVEYPNVSNGKVVLNGEQALAYLRADYDNSNEVFKVLGDAVFKSGLKGIVDNAEIVLEETKTSIVKEDFIDVVGMALVMLKNAETTTINVGEKTYDSLTFNRGNNYIYHCDMEAEREILINTLYGAPVTE